MSWTIFIIIFLNYFFQKFAYLSPLYLVVLLGFSLVLISGKYSDIFYCLSVIVFSRLQNNSSCFYCLFPGGWGHIGGFCRLPHGREWWFTELGHSLLWTWPCSVNLYSAFCWWMGLCLHFVSYLAWGDLSLEPTSCFVELMVASRSAHTREYFPGLLLPASLFLYWGRSYC